MPSNAGETEEKGLWDFICDSFQMIIIAVTIKGTLTKSKDPNSHWKSTDIVSCIDKRTRDKIFMDLEWKYNSSLNH